VVAVATGHEVVSTQRSMTAKLLDALLKATKGQALLVALTQPIRVLSARVTCRQQHDEGVGEHSC
jgi:hypothetical protein